MNGLQTVKSWIGLLTEVGLMLVALAIVVALLFGAQNTAFLGSPVANLINMVTELGKGGLAGLIALGVILWLFSNRTVS
jgi:nitrogen fixation/metabolism regulation signal transduction histidine kinase